MIKNPPRTGEAWLWEVAGFPCETANLLVAVDAAGKCREANKSARERADGTADVAEAVPGTECCGLDKCTLVFCGVDGQALSRTCASIYRALSASEVEDLRLGHST